MELAVLPGLPAQETPVSAMTDRELLEEMALNSRQVRETVTKLIGDLEASPLGAMLKGGGKVNLMQLMMGR